VFSNSLQQKSEALLQLYKDKTTTAPEKTITDRSTPLKREANEDQADVSIIATTSKKRKGSANNVIVLDD